MDNDDFLRHGDSEVAFARNFETLNPLRSEAENLLYLNNDDPLCNIGGDSEAVLADAFEIPHLLSSGAERLSLCLGGDSFYSVGGPAFHVNHIEHPTAHLLDNQVSNPARQSLNISSQIPQHPMSAISKLAIPPRTSFLPIPIVSISSASQHSSRTRSRRRHICPEPRCTWQSPFKTKQGLARHRELVHLQERFDCPIPGCDRVGDKGIKRKDNLRTHVRDRHQVELPHKPHRSYT